MIGYEEIARVQQETQVFILTAPDGHERLLFYYDNMFGKHDRIIARQIPVNGMWRFTEGLLSDQLALRTGGIVTTKERGNHKFLEFKDKEYTVSKTNLYKVMSREV